MDTRRNLRAESSRFRASSTKGDEMDDNEIWSDEENWNMRVLEA
jgi:hypothetical protein